MDPLAELAREAYAHGWALSGGPMTDRVRAGCVAAVKLALEHADEPGILEATLELGKLEGTWAEIYARRDEVHDRNRTAIAKAWTALVAHLDIGKLVRGVRRRAGMVLEAAPVPEPAQPLHDITLSELAAIVRSALENLDSQDAEWTQLRHAFRDAVAAARAEGEASALALAAEQHAVIGFDFELAFTDAYKALENMTSLWTEADSWMASLFGDAASDAGRLLAPMAEAGAPYEDMTSALAGLLEDPDVKALRVAIDLSTSRALSQGALDLYGREGISQVDFLTAGDGRVCSICEQAEANNPHSLADAPKPGLHPFCRCTLAARLSTAVLDLVQQFVSKGA